MPGSDAFKEQLNHARPYSLATQLVFIGVLLLVIAGIVAGNMIVARRLRHASRAKDEVRAPAPKELSPEQWFGVLFRNRIDWPGIREEQLRIHGKRN